jgi:hypothetical protein
MLLTELGECAGAVQFFRHGIDFVAVLDQRGACLQGCRNQCQPLPSVGHIWRNDVEGGWKDSLG